MKKSKTDLLQGNITDTFLKYMVPSVSATILISVNYFIDTLCIGWKIGETGMAALNLSWPITTCLYSLGLLFGTGGGAIFSAYLAQGEKQKARSIYTNGLLALIAVITAITLAGLWNLESIIRFLGATENTIDGVRGYVKWVFVFTFAYIGDCFYASFLRNDNAPKIAMAGTFLSCTFNIILDFLFVFVFDWGMEGASLATSVAITGMPIMGVLYSLKKKSNLKLYFKDLKIIETWNIVKVGFSTFLTEVDVGIVTFIYNTVLLRISGETAVAVYGIVLNVNTIVLAAINGIANALQPIVSANSGAGNLLRVKKFTGMAVKWALGMAVVLVVFLEFKAEWVVYMFMKPDLAFLRSASYAIRAVSASYIIASANQILIAYFQSIQASKEAAFFSFLRSLAAPVVFVIISAFYWGIEGVWWSTLCAESAVVLGIIYSYKRRQRIRMEENLSRLRYFNDEQKDGGLEEWVEKLGLDNLTGYQEVIDYCEMRDTANEGIPMMIGLDDLSDDQNAVFEGAPDDDGFHYILAAGSLIFADLFGQKKGSTAVAMSAVAEKFFRKEKNEEGEDEIVSFDEVAYDYKKDKLEEAKAGGKDGFF